MIAKVEWVKGTITSEQYPVLTVYTGRKSLGHECITLRLTQAAYEEDKMKALAELQTIADTMNYEKLPRQ
jgi:hypothetical protein